MSCCNRSTSNSAIDQAVKDALASRMNELAGYSSSAANSAAAAAAALESSQEVQTAIAAIKAQVQSILDSANDLVPDISNTTGILQDTYEALLNVNDALAGLLVVNYYYTVVGGESTILIPDTYNTSSIRALYIEGARQDPGYGFVYDNVTKLITLAEPFPTEAAGTVVLVQVGVEDADTPETLVGQLASATGAGMVGTSNNSTVQHELDLKAPLSSPAFTDIPTAPTAAFDTNTNQVATMAAIIAATQAFGLGSYAPPTVTAMNDSKRTGFYLYTSTASNIPSAEAGTLIHIQGPSTIFQFALGSTSNNMYVRSYGSAWSSWKLIAAGGVNADITQLTGLTGVSPLPGVTNASEAATGKVGEVLSSTITGVSLTNATTTNMVALTLTPGDWDVYGSTNINTTAGASYMYCALTLTSATIDDVLYVNGGPMTLTTGNMRQPVGPRRVNVSANTTIYLVAGANFSSGTSTATGRIIARRRR